MEENLNKKIILSILGVAILIIFVIGITYAFFLYSKQGRIPNIITTGNLIFIFDDQQTITLNNHFPIDGSSQNEGMNYSGENEVCKFTITGSTIKGTNLDYQIYAIHGADMNGKNRFKDEEIFLNIKRTDNDPVGSFSGNPDYYGNKASGIILDENNELLLGSGSIVATDNDNDAVMTFEVRMWVDKSKVVITDTPMPNETRNVYNTKEYSNMFYTMKIKVNAHA